ncbi:uncharacterized protein LOC133906811 [Phragmites australis]|uniref:uncharacterized protein LOC133906811 n=1 Tax=Phragmites australis TaxID=29695 RepID=UPI002D769BB3|nr:uncharacterized protein LOC133906811 [Phragmites australis]
MASSSSRCIPDGPSTSGRRSSLRQQPPDLQPALLLGHANINANYRTVRKLLVAAGNGDVSNAKKWAKKLIELGNPSVDAAVEAVDNPGTKRHGPLHQAAGTGKEAVCKLLINRFKCSVNATDVHGLYEVAEFLLSKGAEVDPICKDGGTPLHIAAENGDAKMAGADVNADTHLTPLKIAAAKGLADCIECLLKAGAKANIPDELGRMPIEIAAFEGQEECVKILFPATTPLVKYANWSIDEIIRNGLTVSSEPQFGIWLD